MNEKTKHRTLNLQSRATQLADGTIMVVGYNGSDNVYGSMDQAIVQQTFKVIVINTK